MWSVLTITKPALLSMLQPYVCLISFLLKTTMLHTCAMMSSFQILPSCSRPMMSHLVTCHVTVVSYASSSSKRKGKKKQS